MNRSSLSGWKDVFSFTLRQTLKSKAFIVSFIIMLLISVGAMPVISMITKEDTITKSLIQKVYVNDKTGLSETSFLPAITDENYQHIDFVALNEDYDALLKRIDNKETTSVVLDVTMSQAGYFELHFTKSSNGDVTKNDTKALGNLVQEEFNSYIMKVTGVTQEQVNFINSDTVTKVTATDVSGSEIVEENTKISNAQYWFIYGILFILIMVINIASTQIASSIAGDKSTRVVEYLLISVKPLALMLGKILAMLVAVVGQIVVIIIGAIISNQVTATIFSNGGESLLEKYLPSDLFASLSLENIIVCIVVMVLGLTFYGALAGLAGATVSKIEELNEGLTLFMITNMVGFYIGIAAAGTLMGAGMNGFVTFALLFPLSSSYLLPGAILIGRVSLPFAAGAIGIQLIFIILLLRFVAKVYETLILHNGSTVSIKALLKLSKSLKKEAK